MSKTAKQIYTDAMEPLFQQAMTCPFEDKQFYANWLAQTFGFVTKSTRLLAMAGSLFNDDKLHMRFIDHAKEERNHEIMLVNDLKHLGFKMGDVPEFSVTSSFYQSQVYWMLLKDPVAFFGYILCLEGLAVEVGPKVYRRVVEAHGSKAANFLKVHAEEDVGHLDTAFQMLDGLSPYQLGLIEANLRQSIDIYSSILTACGAKTTSLSIAA